MGPTARRAALALLSLALIAGCGGDSDSDQPSAPAESSGEPVQLSFWSWAPNIAKVVDIWNEKNPDIQVKVSQPAQGDDLMTKLITASKAGNAPDLAQAEYQALPSLLMSEVVADISARSSRSRASSATGPGASSPSATPSTASRRTWRR